MDQATTILVRSAIDGASEINRSQLSPLSGVAVPARQAT
jgi:hypothetical protein